MTKLNQKSGSVRRKIARRRLTKDARSVIDHFCSQHGIALAPDELASSSRELGSILFAAISSHVDGTKGKSDRPVVDDVILRVISHLEKNGPVKFRQVPNDLAARYADVAGLYDSKLFGNR